MEGTKINKGPQGNNCRFVRNRREDNSFNQPVRQDNTLTSQGGKINSVKPRYSSADHEMKPGMELKQDHDGNKQESKTNFKEKDGHFHGRKDGQIHVPQKENRSDVKHDHDRRKFNFPKEKANTRNFRPTSRNQGKGNEAPGNDETRTRKQQNKNGRVVLKRNDNANMSSTPQHLKPAVHVQPLQQVPEKNDVRPTVGQNALQTPDSRLRTSSQAGAEGCQDVRYYLFSIAPLFPKSPGLKSIYVSYLVIKRNLSTFIALH